MEQQRLTKIVMLSHKELIDTLQTAHTMKRIAASRLVCSAKKKEAYWAEVVTQLLENSTITDDNCLVNMTMPTRFAMYLAIGEYLEFLQRIDSRAIESFTVLRDKFKGL